MDTHNSMSFLMNQQVELLKNKSVESNGLTPNVGLAVVET